MEERKDGNRWLILAVTAGCFLPVAADATILHVAVPSLTRALGATGSEVLWIVDIYSLLMAGLVLVAGPLGDRIGHQRLLIVGLAAFGAASAACAASSSPGALIAGRAALALGAAMIIPSTLTIIRQVFRDPRERAVAIGIWGAVASGGAAVGPLAGGILLDHFEWGAVFLINVPVTAVAAALVALLLRNRPAESAAPWETSSPLLGIAGILGLVYAVKALASAQPSWPEVAATALAGGLALAAFAWRQLRSTAPMLNLRLFREPRLRIGVMAAFLPFLVMIGFELLLAQDLQFVHGLTPREAGLFLLPLPLAAFVAGPLGGLLVSRHGTGAVVSGGLAVAAAGYWGLSTFPATEAPTLAMACLVLVGAGHGAVMTAASEAIVTSAPDEHVGAAASIEAVSYEVGAGLGIALFGSFAASVYTRAFSLPAGLVPAVPAEASHSVGEAIAIADRIGGPAGDAVAEAARAAYGMAYAGSAVAAALIAAATAIAVALAARRRTRGGRSFRTADRRSGP